MILYCCYIYSHVILYDCIINYVFTSLRLYVFTTTITGDFNARMGNMKDYVEDLDEIPPRTVLDENQNEHGKLFNDFLLQSKMCVLDGRIDPLKDSYTSISHKGRSVVDYLVTQYNCIDNVRRPGCCLQEGT